MNFSDLIGQTLDDKYGIESELGRGGMGTVYLATHLGTERPVAVKVIAPQFMKRPEFVERFRREARAAGRLRHPNVVDVTDFGFAATPEGPVAYLVMEYLDGCTLGEILEEEHNLPIGFTLDILDQVCSAVHEAHTQGIIHRDLKPDNIWLEPNQRGGYTVKVLDFGIAKLEMPSDREAVAGNGLTVPVSSDSARLTSAGLVGNRTVHDSISPTMLSESATILQTIEPVSAGIGERQTIADADDLGTETDQDTVGTQLIDGDRASTGRVNAAETALRGNSGADLTRVGAVLGTPLYMSPEQCRGERLDARSDVYSLGVIAYQMLSGTTPFTGDFADVMEAHKFVAPPPVKAKRVRKKLKRVITGALAKEADCRPQTAEAFANELRSRSEGIWDLLRRAGMIYTEHLPKFLMLSAFFYLPTIFLTLTLVILNFLRASDMLSSVTAVVLLGLNTLVLSVIGTFSAYLIIGTITWIVTQSLAVPLRPIRVRSSLKEARKKWKTFAGTGILSGVLTVIIGILTLGIGFLVMNILWMLGASVVMMENMKGRAALKRSKDLVKRSLMTATAAFCIMFLIPALSAGAISFIVNVTAKAFNKQHSELKELTSISLNQREPPTATGEAPLVPDTPAKPDEIKSEGIEVNFGNNRTIKLDNPAKDMQSRLKDTILESLLQILLLPLQIVATSFTAIIVALLYLKTRQAGGESLQDLLSNFEESDRPRKKWQERVRQRLIQSGRITSRS